MRHLRRQEARKSEAVSKIEKRGREGGTEGERDEMRGEEKEWKRQNFEAKNQPRVRGRTRDIYIYGNLTEKEYRKQG